MDEERATFDPSFRRALRRLRRRSVLRVGARVLPWLEVAWLTVFLAGRLGYAVLPALWVLAALTAILAAAVAWSVWRCPAGRDAALVLDRRLGTRELVTAAHEAGAETPHPLARLARRRAATALAGPAMATALPLTGWRRWRPAILGLAAVLLAGLLPPLRQTADAAVEVDPVVEAAAEELAEKLEPLADRLSQIDRPEAQDALERLQEALDEMASGELPTVEDALVALTRAEESVTAFAEEASGELSELVEELAGEPLSADLARAMTEGDREGLREALKQMADAMTGQEAQKASMQRQIERLAERFEAMADLLDQQGESELAATLRELAQALKSGDLERARELLESEGLAKACKAGGDAAAGEGLAGKLAELMQVGRYLLGQGDPEKLGTGSRGSPGKAAGGGPHPGSESTNEEADGYATGDPILRDRQSNRSSGRTGTFEALYDSRFTQGEGFEEILARGLVGEDGELLSEIGRGLGAEGEASLPLRSVGGAAAGAPERAMDLESVPLGYRDLVRGYFERNPPPSAGEKGDGR